MSYSVSGWQAEEGNERFTICAQAKPFGPRKDIPSKYISTKQGFHHLLTMYCYNLQVKRIHLEGIHDSTQVRFKNSRLQAILARIKEVRF